MTLGGILSESRKGNLSIVNITSIRTLARVKHTSQSKTMPGTSASDRTLETVPEPGSANTANPMMSPMYLSSPLDTILESMRDPNLRYVSLHDLIEAYSVFSSRIRAQLRVIIQANHPLPALAPLKEHSSVLARALTRDIRHVLIDPSNGLRRTPPSGESMFTHISMTDHEIQYARDLTILCHHALRFLSDVFVFKPLYSLFAERDVQDLFNDLLKIALATSLPTPHANKTWSLIFWTIQVQNLPLAVLALKKVEIITALRQSISDQNGLQAKLDSFKAIHNLLKRHSKQFITPLLELLPLVLENLDSESIECRSQAGHALGGFVLAKINLLSATNFPHERVVRTLRVFVEEQSVKQHASQTLHLPGLVANALSVVDSSTTKVPSWAVVVLASLVVLSDASVFFHARSIKFVIMSLRHASRHKHRDICAAHAVVWRTLIWAFSRLSHELIMRQSDGGKPDDLDATKEKVFKTIIQELKGGIGIALVASLLGSTDIEATADVSRALIVIKEMVSGTNHSDPREAILLLNRIVSAIGTPFTPEALDNEWHRNIDPSLGIFDGTIIDASLNNLGSALDSLGDVRVDRVRQLSETELVHHWNDLIAIWIEGVGQSLQDPTFALSGELLHSWQSLLLVQAHLTQEHSHLTASSAFARHVASIVARFLVQLDDPRAQLRRIQFVQKLWGVMKNVFSSPWLSSPAEIILSAVLKHNFTLADEEVKLVWSQLCAALISVGIPTLLHVVNFRSGFTEGLQVTRQLWTVLARAFQAPDGYVDWDDVICLLVIPFKAWVMSDSELKVWDDTLRKAVSMAGAAGTKSSVVVRRVLGRMNWDIAKLISLPKAVAILLGHVDLSDDDALPVDVFSMVDVVLVSNYPPLPESLATCLEILRLTGQIISATPVSMLVQLLTTIGESLRFWIGDSEEVMLESEFNGVVNNVYCRALDSLCRLEPSLERLIAISPFLATAFVRVPHPASGPIAFESFWRGTYHDLPQYRPFYPDCLKACLMGLADVCGGSLGEGLSMGTETQITQMSTVPDSQPNHYVGESQEFVADTFHSSSDTKGRVQHHPDHMAALQQLNDYDSLDNYSYLNEESLRSKHSAKEDNLTSRRSSRLLTPTSSDTWRRKQTSSPLRISSPSRIDLHDQVALSTISHAYERKRPIDPSADRRSVKRRKTDTEIYLKRSLVPNIRRTQSENNVQSCLINLEPLPSSFMKSETPDCRGVMDWDKQPSSPGFFKDPLRTPGRRNSAVCLLDDLCTTFPAPSSEDYKSWEAGVSAEEMQKLRRELVGFGGDLELVEIDTDNRSEADEDPVLAAVHNTGLLSPLLRPTTIPTQTRAQTAPGSIPLRPHRSPPLRRHQTTGSSTRIEALQRAYTAVVNDESQVPVEDLVQATALVNRIGTRLNEQMEKRLKATSRTVIVGVDES